jgi:nucleoside-diphosphate-sugar epimerase
MTMKRVLITGVSGFIGGHVAINIFDKAIVTGLVRPGTSDERYSNLVGKINIVELDLSDSIKLEHFLDNNIFDFIFHIGALRGGRNSDKHDFIRTNVDSTQIFIKKAIINKTSFVFCSSVGVFGTIPSNLPATNSTKYNDDNLYHRTKILCEEMIKKAIIENNLHACIVRPAITYGIGDYGFPYTLTKLVSKRLLFLPTVKKHIHLTNINLLADVFTQLLTKGYKAGKIWNVADRKKVCFYDLIDFINNRLGKSDKYPKSRFVKIHFFTLLKRVAVMLKSELWTSRIELLSNDWYFDVEQTYIDFKLKDYNTIPLFSIVVDWYNSK